MSSSSVPRLESFIGGKFEPSDSPFHDDINPSDRSDVIALVPAGSPDDAAKAVTAAAGALEVWKSRTGPQRAESLSRWAESIHARRDELATEMAREVGKPISESRGEVARCSAILRYYAGEAVRSLGDVIPPQSPGAMQFTLREPLGVVALITPWNFPLAIPLWKAAPALAFGNTVVVKPAEMSSKMASLLSETALAAEMPAGVFNVLLGTGSIVGKALLDNEAVRAVSFTGSGAVGAQVAATAARRNIRFQTEMGGKNVVIVAEDADLDLAAALTASGAMRYAGQKCTATSRAVIARTIEDKFLAKLREKIEALPLGPVEDPAAAVGPLINEQAEASVRGALGREKSDRIWGGVLPSDDRFRRGFYTAPAIVRGPELDSEIARDEIFGPVLATFLADDMEEAISIANRTSYGLSASVFTRDLSTAFRFIRRIEAGLVRVNGDTTGVDPHAPFGGMKGSSSGSREQGPAAREFYTEIKTVQIQP